MSESLTHPDDLPATDAYRQQLDAFVTLQRAYAQPESTHPEIASQMTDLLNQQPNREQFLWDTIREQVVIGSSQTLALLAHQHVL